MTGIVASSDAADRHRDVPTHSVRNCVSNTFQLIYLHVNLLNIYDKILVPTDTTTIGTRRSGRRTRGRTLHAALPTGTGEKGFGTSH